MVAKPHISDCRKPGLEGAACRLSRFQQGEGGGISLYRRHHIRFRPQTQMNVTIDQAGKDRQSSSIDPLGSFGRPDVPVRTDRHDACTFDHKSASLKAMTQTIQNSHLPKRDGHGVLLIGMVTMMPPMMSLSA